MENLVIYRCSYCCSPQLEEQKGGLIYCKSCNRRFEKKIEKNVESEEALDARISFISQLGAAENLLRESPPRFYDAESKFRLFIEDYPDYCDGYWGLVRARYGIKYEKDVNGQLIPSCYISDYEDFLKDEDYEKALELAKKEATKDAYYYLKDQGDIIADICKEWREKVGKYNYDIFISFKDEDKEQGISDEDRKEMTELYTHLLEQKYNVFFSPYSMENHAGKYYDPYILGALQSAKVLIVYGSKPEYFTSTWVQNEWTRFFGMIEKQKKKPGSCIAVYNGFNPKLLPKDLRETQAIDASKDNRLFYPTLLNTIKNLLEDDPKPNETEDLMKKVEALMRRFENQEKANEDKKEIHDPNVADTVNAPTTTIKPTATTGPKSTIPGTAAKPTTKKTTATKPRAATAPMVNIDYTADPDFEIVDGHLVAYKGNKTDIVIPNSVTSIDKQIFSNKNITSVVIPDRVTSIGDKMFCGCVKLESVVIPDSVTSIGNQAFLGCRNLKSVVIPDSVTTIGKGAFSDCKNLSNVTIGNNVESIEERAFEKCEQLVSIKIPDRVAFIGEYAFYNCTNLASVVIGKRVYYIESYAFMGCDNLFVVYDNSKLNLGIGYTTDGYIAKYAKILVRNGVARYADDGYAYTLTDDGFLFRKKDHKYELISYIGNEDTITLPTNINGNNYETSRLSSVRNIIIPKSFTTIKNDAFAGWNNLISVEIPDTVTSIGDSAFKDCKKLATITIPNSVTSIGNSTFEGCESLAEVMIPDTITSIGDSVFKDCKKLATITIPNSVTSIGNYTFGGCEKLTNIAIPDSVTSIGYFAFSNCNSLTGMTISDNVALIGSCAFWSCKNLASVVIGQRVTSINDSMFYRCESLTNVTIGNSVTEIAYDAFGYCESLSKIVIPDSVTSVGTSAFNGCKNLSEIIIPDSVTSIGDYVFDGCKNLKDIYYTGSKKKWRAIKKGIFNLRLKLATVHFDYVLEK